MVYTRVPAAHIILHRIHGASGFRSRSRDAESFLAHKYGSAYRPAAVHLYSVYVHAI